MSIYDVFYKNEDGAGDNDFNKEEWAKKKQKQREDAYEMVEKTCEKMLSDGEAFRDYLKVQGRFDRYSVTNAVLVSAQMPNAAKLKDYRKWRSERVYVDKGANKVVILEPGKEYIREDGTQAVSYNAKVVYDISQTSVKDKAGKERMYSIRNLISALIDASPAAFQPTDELSIPAFYDKEKQTIFVKTGLTEEQLFKAVAKEVSAAIYHVKFNEDREISNFKSYYIAFMTASKYGMDTSDFNFNKVPEVLKGFEPQTLKSELGKIRDVLGEIQTEMHRSLEKNAPMKNREQER